MRRNPQAVREQRKAARRLTPISQPGNTPAPFGGLNTRDSLDAMQRNQAVTMENWFPSEGAVSVRPGYSLFIDLHTSGTIESMGNYKAGLFDLLLVGVSGGLVDPNNRNEISGTTNCNPAANILCDTTKNFVASGVVVGAFVENTTDGTYALVTVVAATQLTLDASIMDISKDYSIVNPKGTGYSSNDWDFDNFDGELMMCNGTDDPLRYDSTLTLTANNWLGIADDAALSIVHSFKNRLFYATGDDQSFWYADTVYIKTGTLVEFPIGRIGSVKGNVVALNSWTVDGGEGIDDYFVIATSGGQIIVYQGTDPGSAINWALVGIYNVAEPVNGRNCFKKVGTDLMYLSTDDVVTVREIMARGYIGQRSLISGGIREAVDADSGVGWQMHLWAEGRIFLVNHPDGSDYSQFVQNTITGAWSKWTAITARCWVNRQTIAFFGSTQGKIYLMGGDDDDGSAIVATCQQAYTDFGSQSEKVVNAIRPMIESTGTINYNIDLSFDYEDITVATPASVSPTAGQVINKEWFVSGGEGSKIAPKLVVNALQKIVWRETDYRITQMTNL